MIYYEVHHFHSCPTITGLSPYLYRVNVNAAAFVVSSASPNSTAVPSVNKSACIYFCKHGSISTTGFFFFCVGDVESGATFHTCQHAWTGRYCQLCPVLIAGNVGRGGLTLHSLVNHWKLIIYFLDNDNVKNTDAKEILCKTFHCPPMVTLLCQRYSDIRSFLILVVFSRVIRGIMGFHSLYFRTPILSPFNSDVKYVSASCRCAHHKTSDSTFS